MILLYTIHGDKMIKKIKKAVFPILVSVICGSICGKLVYDIYSDKLDNAINGSKIYLLEAGSYSNYDNMVKNTLVNNYVYYEDNDGLYKAIIGITESSNNVSKIKSIYDSDVVISEYFSTDKNLNKKIKEYDKKIEKLDSKEEIKKIVLEVLTLYKEKDSNTLIKYS